MLRAEGVADQVLPEPYERIHSQTMGPMRICSGARPGGHRGRRVQRARAFVRKRRAQSGGSCRPALPHLTARASTLETLRGAIQAALPTFERTPRARRPHRDGRADSRSTSSRSKPPNSRSKTVMSAMRACGLSGYRNDSEFAMGRYLRDILSSPIMINNDRILANARGRAC